MTARPAGEVQQVLEYLRGTNLTVMMVSYSLLVRGGLLVVERKIPYRPEVGDSSGGAGESTISVSTGTLGKEPPVGEPPGDGITFQVGKEEKVVESPAQSFPAGALPTEPAKRVAKPPGPGTKPGVMA